MQKMDYRRAVDWMCSALPMFQKIGSAAYRPGLENTEYLMDYLGHPERGLRCIHVAGTNGKGSTSSMLASVLMEAGYRTGLYTSPHLIDFRERMRVDGEMIPKEFVADFVERHLDFFTAHSFSFFEMTTAMAFCWFRACGVDVAVVETGLGGRLDSTNVVRPDLSVITNIALDHTAILGDTRVQIAGEKAGIIKPGVPVLIGENDPEIEPVFRAKAAREGAPLYFTDHGIRLEDYPCPLEGDYQRFNIATVVAACGILRESWKLDPQTVRRGLAAWWTIPTCKAAGRCFPVGRWWCAIQATMSMASARSSVSSPIRPKAGSLWSSVWSTTRTWTVCWHSCPRRRSIVLRRLPSSGRWIAGSWHGVRRVFRCVERPTPIAKVLFVLRSSRPVPRT